jgi:hypothetical protein
VNEFDGTTDWTPGVDAERIKQGTTETRAKHHGWIVINVRGDRTYAIRGRIYTNPESAHLAADEWNQAASGKPDIGLGSYLVAEVVGV